MKRFFSIILSATFVFSAIVPCYAYETTSNINMVENMVNCGASKLLSKSTDSTDIENYTIETAGNLANIKKESASKGMLYTVQEGTLTNEVLITPNKQIYLDGKMATVSTTTQVTAQSTAQSIITPMSYYEYWDFDDTAIAPGPYTSNQTTTKPQCKCNRK